MKSHDMLKEHIITNEILRCMAPDFTGKLLPVSVRKKIKTKVKSNNQVTTTTKIH